MLFYFDSQWVGTEKLEMAALTGGAEQLMEATHVLMEDRFQVYDRVMSNQIGKLLLAASDTEGFVVPFDLAWEWAGYSTKGNAKQKLVGARGNLGLKLGTDYIISKSSSDPQTIILQKQNNSSRPVMGVETRGRKTEKIMMTGRAFGQFALAAQTIQGTMCRDFALEMMRGISRLQEAIKNGEVELKRSVPSSNTRDNKRLKVCESQKTFMQVVAGTDGANGGLCAKVNGATNKAVTGRYKYETAKMLGKKPSQVNARDYMTPGQLVLAEAAEILSEKVLRDGGGGGDVFKTHTDILARLGEATALVKGECLPEPRRLNDIRKDQQKMAGLCDAPVKPKKKKNQKNQENQENQKRKANAITTYFK